MLITPCPLHADAAAMPLRHAAMLPFSSSIYTLNYRSHTWHIADTPLLIASSSCRTLLLVVAISSFHGSAFRFVTYFFAERAFASRVSRLYLCCRFHAVCARCATFSADAAISAHATFTMNIDIYTMPFHVDSAAALAVYGAVAAASPRLRYFDSCCLPCCRQARCARAARRDKERVERTCCSPQRALARCRRRDIITMPAP